MTTDLRAAMRDRQAGMLDDLAVLVGTESPSDDLVATARCAQVVADLGRRLLGASPQTLTAQGRTHLAWRFGTPRVLLLGHFDTVWPIGTLARWPFEVRDGMATGPGVFDMKAGIVAGFHALAALDDLDGVAVLLTSDEEIGSDTSRAIIEDTARGLDAVLVLEPSAAGAVKVGRKGASNYELAIRGRAAHAGLEPENGINALVELAHQVLALQRLARPHEGTTVTPTVASAGTGTNVVPELARVAVDVRVATVAEQARVDAAIRTTAAVLPGARLSVGGGPNRPPLAEEMSRPLYERLVRVATTLGLDPPGAAHVGGASDGNFTAALGVPTLDGLGAVGDGAHAEGEHVEVASLPERAAVVAALTDELRRGGSRR
ncbi:M20 family metallopeptidase [Egicoccus sp. AB-alg6-2]|uniref:M20 family metallopeptidase n=1 Tax=Egicoccus sp. AB-alg6-2 TaxID=3242692 RepID=UPI00359CC41B